jgi:hypothetical protein
MKLMNLYIVSLILIMTQAAHSSGLIGCPNPDVIANALQKLQERNWGSISVEKVESIWPTGFDELACESKSGCRLLVSKNRVIGGHCECCESFAFDVEAIPGGSHAERLDNFIVHYSAPSKGEVVHAAQRLAQGAGLTSVEAMTIGNDSNQRYEWKDSREQVRQSYILELQFTRANPNWELYFSLGAVPM